MHGSARLISEPAFFALHFIFSLKVSATFQIFPGVSNSFVSFSHWFESFVCLIAFCANENKVPLIAGTMVARVASVLINKSMHTNASYLGYHDYQ